MLLGLGDRRDVVLRGVIKTHGGGANVPEYVRKSAHRLIHSTAALPAIILTSVVRMSILNNQQVPKVDF